MEDAEFFSSYRNFYEKTTGIPNVRMNGPIAASPYVGMLGLELEMEAVNGLPTERNLSEIKGPKTDAGWTTHMDGSLRGNSIEYVLSQPCLLEELDGLVSGLYSALQAYKTQLALSNRCSTHVHYNVSGKKVNLITSAIALFVTFEDVFIPWCGEERTNNHFCLSTRESHSMITAWNNYLRTGQAPARRELKYSALNIVPIFDRGSLEVRCGPLPESAEKVVTWAKFVYALLTFAMEKYPNPNQLGYDISERGGFVIFEDICKDIPGLFEEMTRGRVDLNDNLILQGFRRAQSLVLGHPWEQWMELVNREYVPDPFGKTAKKAANPLRVNRIPIQANRRPDAVEQPLNFDVQNQINAMAQDIRVQNVQVGRVREWAFDAANNRWIQ